MARSYRSTRYTPTAPLWAMPNLPFLRQAPFLPFGDLAHGSLYAPAGVQLGYETQIPVGMSARQFADTFEHPQQYPAGRTPRFPQYVRGPHHEQWIPEMTGYDLGGDPPYDRRFQALDSDFHMPGWQPVRERGQWPRSPRLGGHPSEQGRGDQPDLGRCGESMEAAGLADPPPIQRVYEFLEALGQIYKAITDINKSFQREVGKMSWDIDTPQALNSLWRLRIEAKRQQRTNETGSNDYGSSGAGNGEEATAENDHPDPRSGLGEMRDSRTLETAYHSLSRKIEQVRSLHQGLLQRPQRNHERKSLARLLDKIQGDGGAICRLIRRTAVEYSSMDQLLLEMSTLLTYANGCKGLGDVTVSDDQEHNG